MKRSIPVLLSLLIPLICWAAEPAARTVTYEYDTGPLPPEYHRHSNLTISLDEARRILNVTNEVERGYKEDRKTMFKADLGGPWYSELDEILKRVPKCQQDQKQLIGGPTKIMVVGQGSETIRIKWQNVCEKDKAWWSGVERFFGDVSLAVEKLTMKTEERQFRYMKVSNGSVVTEITIRPDSVTRTAKVYVSGKFIKELNTDEFRKFKDLLSAPNYYNDGKVTDHKLQKEGEFIDRGEGFFYSFEKGLADPLGRNNTREALTDFFSQFDKHTDLYKNVGRTITVNGEVSNVMWQHMIQFTKEYPHSIYLDFDKGQTVVYSKEPIECKGKISVIGRVIKIEGGSKDPRRKEAVDEYHIQADKWTCRD